jgi:hypothetical protein
LNRTKSAWDNCSAAIATGKSEETGTTEEAIAEEEIEALALCTKGTGLVLLAGIPSRNFRLNRTKTAWDNCFAAIATSKSEA